MSEFKKIYEDKDVKLFERNIPLEDSSDTQRTLIIKISDKEYGFEFAFDKLIHTWIK